MSRGFSLRFALLFSALVVSAGGLANPARAFRFGSISDVHVETTTTNSTLNQVKGLSPEFILFNGDLENDGVVNTEMDPMTTIFKNLGLYNMTFFVRGNHDDHVSGSAALWQTYFTNAARTMPAGATNYVGIDSSSTYLTYSFDYGNSRFIGLDSNTNGDLPTSAQLTFLDQRLTDAENLGLTHAFIFVHPPEYCVESTHCGCQTTTGCGPSTSFINIINKHPIVSATIHGHEHILAWVHMNSTRVPGLTHEYEEFFTSSAGEPYSFTPYTARMDWYNYSSSLPAFGIFDVNGNSFTVGMYHTGTATPLWTQTFTKGTATPTVTPKAPTVTPTPGATGSRPLKYYVVDRVRSNTDFATLAAWGVNTAVVDFKTDGSTSSWDSVVNAAAAAKINLVIWPDAHQGSDVNGCRWETPFDDGTANGDYLSKIRTILSYLGNKPNVIGIVTAHEPVWVDSGSQDRCSENVADMTTIKTQIHDYIDNTVHRNASYPAFKVWNYIDNIYNMSNLIDYSSTNKKAQIQGIMDVAVIWQHCAGYPTNAGDGSACEGSGQYTALGGINADRNLIKNNGLEGTVEEVFIIQTFNQGTSGDYGGIFTPAQLQTYSCDFLKTNSLDGFGYYTWDEGWYTGNLKKYYTGNPTDYNNVLNYINANCVVKTTVTPTTAAATPTPTTVPAKPGDGNNDGNVDGLDYVIWLNNYGATLSTATPSQGDFNEDKKVDGLDYVVWLNNYGK